MNLATRLALWVATLSLVVVALGQVDSWVDEKPAPVDLRFQYPFTSTDFRAEELVEDGECIYTSSLQAIVRNESGKVLGAEIQAITGVLLPDGEGGWRCLIQIDIPITSFAEFYEVEPTMASGRSVVSHSVALHFGNLVASEGAVN